MKVLHTESSRGWGGQEIRIFQEALGMRKRGYEVYFAVQRSATLALKAKEAGFTTYEIDRLSPFSPLGFLKLIAIILKHKIDLVNTHSSSDAWLAGLAARLCFKRIVRTRHLSTPIKKGINSFLLYNMLTDRVVTTCAATAKMIQSQAHLPKRRIESIPTGVDPSKIVVKKEDVAIFRKKWGIQEDECVAGTLSVLRWWKGISDLLQAAKQSEDPKLKWLIVGGGVSEEYFLNQYRELKLEEKVIFTGHIDNPYIALGAIDIFLLLSFANEGVSQATLQAAWLKKPLITTPIGGLNEVCIDQVTGLIVPCKDPTRVAQAVQQLHLNPQKRLEMGQRGHNLVKQQFTFEQTLDGMEHIYGSLSR